MRLPLAAIAVVALVGGGVAAAEATMPDPARPRAPVRRLTPVVGSLAICPELLPAGGAVTTRLTLGTAQAGDVKVEAAAVGGTAAVTVALDGGGHVAPFTAPAPSTAAVLASATGAASGGVVVEQLARGDRGNGRGLAGVRCEATAAESWFVGAATTISDDTDLVLVNPYDDAAVVDVTFVDSTDEPIDVPGARGVAVPPRSRVVRPLAAWVPGRAAFAVKVAAQSGRVSSAVRRSRVVDGVPSGVDWLPRTDRPAETVTLGALPAGNGSRTLLLVNPGDEPALAKVIVTHVDGQFVPDGLAELVVPAHRLLQVPLTDVLGGKAAGVRVTTDGRPLLAGAVADNQGAGKAQEIAFLAGLAALDGPALLTDTRSTSGADTRLLLFAPDGAAEVTITGVPVRGASGPPPVPKVVVLQHGELQSVRVASVTRGRDGAVVVTPSGNSSAVYGTRVVSASTPTGPLLTTLGIRSQSVAGVPVPAVSADPRAWLVPVTEPAR
ncbi:MAG TPA: DUF5719 family protein [Mycobacteriales bacterium]|jgi:hypothetical protein|nr:DUF5719 family protein [Mycobacteriales bacterium]